MNPRGGSPDQVCRKGGFQSQVKVGEAEAEMVMGEGKEYLSSSGKHAWHGHRRSPGSRWSLDMFSRG